MERSLKHEHGRVKSFLTPLTSKEAPVSEEGKTKTSHKSQGNDWSVPWQWSGMRKAIRRRKVISLVPRRSNAGCNHKTVPQANCSQVQVSSSEENSSEEIEPMSQDNICHSGFKFPHLIRHGSQHNHRGQRSHDKLKCHSSASLNEKHQPKLFEDIVGHEIVIKAISNAVQKKKVAHLYLFHGPNGTGKTSTARIFAMALLCESTSHSKPCWSCKGCSRSVYIMELCSGSRITGFQRISTLLQSTSFTQAIPGFKVFIIEECHSLTAEAWDELLGIVEGSDGSTLIFVLVTANVTMLPKTIASRCQKYYFPKLKEMDITLKLARIIAQEGIGIEREALKLIVVKAEGSLREAENLLDQLTLLGLRITTSMVQQIVGLVPHNKLINLLATALSGDTKRTILYTREIIETGVEAHAIVSQLASLITDILSGATGSILDSASSVGPSTDKRMLKSGSQLTNTQSERLCYALKILVELEKQPVSSIDHTARIFATLLEITTQDVSRAAPGNVLPKDIILASGVSSETSNEIQMTPSGDISKAEPVGIQLHRLSHSGRWTNHQSIDKTSEQQNMNRTELSTTKRDRGKAVDKEFNLECMRNMEKIWLNMLEKIQNGPMKEFLCRQVKLASVTVSSANAIVHLMFKRTEDKLAAQMAEESISEALEKAMGCRVTVNMSLEPVNLGNIEEYTVSTSKSQQLYQHTQQKLSPLSDDNLRLMKLKLKLKDGTQVSQGKERSPTREPEATTIWPQQMLPFSGLLTQDNPFDASVDPKSGSLEKNHSALDIGNTMGTEKPKHRWLSLSSIQQSDASVEPYSQDILFENAYIDKESRARKNPKLQRSSSKAYQDYHSQGSARSIGLHRSWSCKEIFCPRQTKVKTMQHDY